jgi:branched-chain amino acid transport system permease protein
VVVAGRRGHALLALAALAVALMPLYASNYHLQLASTALVAAMFALSLQLLVGAAGMVSLGHAAFFGIGAYAVHLLPPGLSIALTLPAAAALAAAAALPVGALSLRTRGFFFLMTTLAFGQMLFFVFHDTPLGGGKDGVFVTRPALELFGLALEVPRRSRPAAMLWLNLGLLVLVYAGLAALMGTLFGRALLGIRANEDRMRAMGYDTRRVKLAAFVLAGALAGVAGHMQAMAEAFVTPEMLAWHHGAEALLMILLGGLGALHGPILGAFALVGLGEASTLITERQRLVEGLVILAVVLVLPRGLAGLRLPRPRRPAAPAAPTAGAAVGTAARP